MRWAYGFGQASEGIKNNAFNVFLLFFYQQVVGLDPVLCGAALFVALLVDAVTDPLIGMWSDGLVTRLGRRHPLMYAAPIPMAACFYAVFHPPALSSTGLFAWLLVFAVGTRVAMTLFAVPHQALLAELTDDYDERTVLQARKMGFGSAFGLVNALLAYLVFLAATDAYPDGLHNPAGYHPLSLFGAAVMVISCFVSAAGTQKAAMAAPSKPSAVPLSQLPTALAAALRLRSYRAVVLGGLFLYTGFGLQENLNNYVNTLFWGLGPEQLGFFVLVILVCAFVVTLGAGPLTRRLDKRRVAMGAVVLGPLMLPLAVAAKLAGLLPPNGSTELLGVLCIVVFVSYTALILGMTMVGTMIADVTDQHAAESGERQEGLLFAAQTFLVKASSGLGVFVAGGIVQIAGVAEGMTRDTAPDDVVWRLGFIAAACGLALGVAAAAAFSTYDLGRDELEALR